MAIHWTAQKSIDRIKKNLFIQDYNEEDIEHCKTIMRALELLRDKEESE